MDVQQSQPVKTKHGVQGLGGRASQGEGPKPPKEEESAHASASNVQPPITRRPASREPDPPVEPEPENTVPPIQRPDPDPRPIVPRMPGPERGAGA